MKFFEEKRWVRISLLALLLLLAPATALAQRVEPPPADAAKWYLTIFTHSDWAQRPQEKMLIDSLGVEPMAALKAKTHFKHYTPADPVYASGRFPTITEADFPVVILSDARGGYIYKASRKTLPLGGDVLFEEMKQAYRRDRALVDTPTVPSEQLTQEDCPDGICPPSPDSNVNRDPVFPNAPWNIDSQVDESLEGLFGGDTPVRDSLGYVAWIFGAIVAVGFLMVGFGGLVALTAVVVWAFRAFTK